MRFSELIPVIVPITSLTPDPANVRKHSEKNIEAIKASLAQFGQRKPIVVRREGMTVTAGNGTLQAAKDLGWRDISAVITDDSLEDATKYAIADNRSAELAEWDRLGLSQLIGGLQDAGSCILDMGFDQIEIDQLLESHTSRAPRPDSKGEKDNGESNDEGEVSPSADSEMVPQYVVIGQECMIIEEDERRGMLDAYEEYRKTVSSGKGFFKSLLRGKS